MCVVCVNSELIKANRKRKPLQWCTNVRRWMRQSGQKSITCKICKWMNAGMNERSHKHYNQTDTWNQINLKR